MMVKFWKKTGMIAILLINNIFLIQAGPTMIALLVAMFNIKGQGEGYAYDRYAITYDSGIIGLLIFLLVVSNHVIINRLCLKELNKMKYFFWVIELIVVLCIFSKIGPFIPELFE